MDFFQNFTPDKLLFVPAALIAIVFHELCHGLVANMLGDPTAKSLGRLSLNPIRHIDPIGALMLIIVGFGWAKPVPVDMRYFRKPKRDMALVALAGPAANFVVALLSLVFVNLLGFSFTGGSFYYNEVIDGTSQYWGGVFFLYCAMINVGLGVFNLFPIPPLDGSKMLGAFLPDRWYYQLMRFERYGMFVLMFVLWMGWLSPALGTLRGWVLFALDIPASLPAKLLGII